MRDTIWKCLNGRHILVGHMHTDHIINCMRLIERSGYRWRGRYYARLQLELDIRSVRNYDNNLWC